MQYGTWTLLAGIWIGWILLWVLWALRAKTPARSETRAQNALHMGPLLAACLMLALPRLPSGVLCGAFLSDAVRHVVQPGGVVLTLAGLAITIWARGILGNNWSGDVAIKQDHVLIDIGPYALVRHPIYTGLLLALLGSGMAWGEWRGLVAPVIAGGSFWWKLRREEIWLSEQFGATYRQYMARTKALIPYLI